MFVQLLIFVLSIQQIVLAKTNYCDKSLCQNQIHIGCNNNGQFARSCPKSAQIIDLSKEFKALIVAKHNEKRNNVASGQLSPYNSASRMATMQWDDELAHLAELNLKTCKNKHDCHNTKEFKFSGQNLAFVANSEDSGLEFSVNNMIESWYEEHFLADSEVIKEYRLSSNKVYGHFTVMVADRNYKVGCAVLKYSYVSTTGTLMIAYELTCNYAFTNMLGEPIYKSGRPGSGCKKGTNPHYHALCSIEEQYNVYSG